ncbi:PD-(D/E)XK nuclease family protein [Actinomyces marmotae]|uniref:DNA 3'-5' helicase n=3 Tax=Actinomyces marmotae TaxID=2737173 RepID=A0A6M8AY38_9ACTO|nr:PD-(D/E)XK nuclease family protein [Actinomyces marmotae]QKD79389.1 ATP-dependent helicase [Actinomyces marmotae]
MRIQEATPSASGAGFAASAANPAITASPRLLPAPALEPLPEPDASARAVLAAVSSGDNIVVLGAPGTGKTSLALRMLVGAVERGTDAVLLAPTRARADRLRQRAASLLSAHGGGVVRVRTPASLALAILTASLTQRPDPLPAPVLLAGAEEDAALASLIRPEQWPGLPPEAVGSRAFRAELRNLLARAGELGVTADDLAGLGCALDVPLWGPASALLRTWDAQGRPSAERRADTRRMDTARLQDRAAEALASWDADGVAVPQPVPGLVIVDDYQDCTAATARFLAALARSDERGHRAQVVVLGDPDVAVETFRGGSPSLLSAAEDRSGLAARRLRLSTLHRGTPALAALWADQAGRLPVTGSAAHRHPGLSPERGGGAATAEPVPGGAPLAGPGGAGAPSGIEPIVASSAAQEAAHVARVLRAEHIHHATPWREMAVIVRSAGRAQAVARELGRRGVPLAASAPAVLLRAEPAAAALLRVSRAALDGRLGAVGEPPERAAAIDLLTSPLVGLSLLDLRRLRRRLREDRPAQTVPDEHLLAALASAGAGGDLAVALTEEPLAEQAARLARAARIIEALRGVVGLQGPRRDEGPESAEAPPDDERVDAEALLWAAWSASGCAERWRGLALAGDHGAPLARAAERDLDVVTALFKRAEVWAERHPGAHAAVFLTELAAEVLPSDSVAPAGVRPEGVSVLTPAAAAGREWAVVAVMGLGRDSWPDLRLRDSITRSGLLVDAVTGRLPVGADGAPTGALDVTAARAQVRADERRMLLAALTRATRRLIATAVQDADDSPSSFLIEVATAAGRPLTDAGGDTLIAPDTGDLTLRGLVGELRHALLAAQSPRATALERQRGASAAALLARLAGAGVAGADPATWGGLSEPTSTEPLVAGGQPVRVSPSDVEGLTTCALRWFLQRNGAGGAPTGAQALGTLIHSIAERAQREGLRGTALMEVFEERLPELGLPPTWIGSLEAERAREMIRRLDARLTAVPGQVEVERSIDATLVLPLPPGADAGQGRGDGGAPPSGGTAGATIEVRLRGRIDRLEAIEGQIPPAAGQPGAPLPGGTGQRLRLIDLKTGKSAGEGDASRHPQLTAYRLALESLGYRVDGGALVLLGAQPRKKDGGVRLAPDTAALAPIPDPETGEDWAATLVARAALAARGPRLRATTGGHCEFCAVKDACPAVDEGRRTLP